MEHFDRQFLRFPIFFSISLSIAGPPPLSLSLPRSLPFSLAFYYLRCITSGHFYVASALFFLIFHLFIFYYYFAAVVVALCQSPHRLLSLSASSCCAAAKGNRKYLWLAAHSRPTSHLPRRRLRPYK